MKEEGLPLRTAVDCLLLPLSDHRLALLVPLNAVAEVVDAPPAARVATGLSWLQGWLRWRDRDIPVLAHEGIARTEFDPPGGNVRVVIFNAIGAAAAQGFYGLAIRDLPRPLRLGPESDLRAQEVAPPRGTAMVVEIGGEPAAVPDFELLEQLVVEAGTLHH